MKMRIWEMTSNGNGSLGKHLKKQISSLSTQIGKGEKASEDLFKKRTEIQDVEVLAEVREIYKRGFMDGMSFHKETGR